jgi:hypothetical protein
MNRSALGFWWKGRRWTAWCRVWFRLRVKGERETWEGNGLFTFLQSSLGIYTTPPFRTGSNFDRGWQSFEQFLRRSLH